MALYCLRSQFQAECYQLDSRSSAEIDLMIDWLWDHKIAVKRMQENNVTVLYINSDDGCYKVTDGMWIIKDHMDDFFALDDSVFKEMYSMFMPDIELGESYQLRISNAVVASRDLRLNYTPEQIRNLVENAPPGVTWWVCYQTHEDQKNHPYPQPHLEKREEI